VNKKTRPKGPGHNFRNVRQLAGGAFLHRAHRLLGLSLRAELAHHLHRRSGLAVHHRAFVARGIEGDIERLGERRTSHCHDENGGEEIFLHGFYPFK